MTNHRVPRAAATRPSASVSLAGLRQPQHTTGMLIPHESLQQMRERHERELAAFRKQLRRERWSMFTFLFAWMIYVSVLPFIYSPDLIMLMLGILLIFYGQFIFVMGMD